MSETKDKAKEIYELYIEKIELERFIANNNDRIFVFSTVIRKVFYDTRSSINIKNDLYNRMIDLMKNRIKEIDEILNKLQYYGRR